MPGPAFEMAQLRPHVPRIAGVVRRRGPGLRIPFHNGDTAVEFVLQVARHPSVRAGDLQHVRIGIDVSQDERVRVVALSYPAPEIVFAHRPHRTRHFPPVQRDCAGRRRGPRAPRGRSAAGLRFLPLGRLGDLLLLIVGQRQSRGADVLHQMVDAGGAGNGQDHGRAVQQPSQGELGNAGVVAPGDLIGEVRLVGPSPQPRAETRG